MTAADILRGDRRSIARAATLVESRRGNGLLRELFPHAGRARIVGITGAPGAGKSTLVDQLARAVRKSGQTVAIVAVDPSSPFTGGAILGDRIRMSHHHQDPGVYIRSMATRGALGGLATATADLTLLLDAAGFDVVIVETVGVGQDEVEIARLAAVTVVVLVPGMGDDVQAIKAGLMEIADIFVINKADRDGVERLERELTHGDFRAPVLRTIATEGTGIGELLTAIREVPTQVRMAERWRYRLREMIRERLLETISWDQLGRSAEEIARRERDPYTVVEEYVEQLRSLHTQRVPD